MRWNIRIISGFCVAALLGAAAVGVLSVAKSNEGSTGRPRICIDPISTDWGIIAKPSEKTAIYCIRNVGGQPLVIRKLTLTCSCGEPRLDRKTIPPGENANMRVTFRLPVDPGPWSAKIGVLSNDPENAIVTLEARAYVRLPAIVTPQDIRRQSIPEGQFEKVELSIWGPSDARDFKVVSGHSDNPLIVVHQPEPGPLVQGSERRNWNVGVELLGSSGGYAGTVYCTVEGGMERELSVPVTVQGSSRVIAEPALLVFQRAAVGEAREAMVRFRTRDSQERLEITGIECPNWLEAIPVHDRSSGQPCLRVRTILSRGESSNVPITIRFSTGAVATVPALCVAASSVSATTGRASQALHSEY